jgi:hypothetical protein
LMFAQLLDCDHIQASALSGARLEEALSSISKEPTDLVVLSGLPPFALARAHRLNRLLRARTPQVKVMFASWSSDDEDLARAAGKLPLDNGFHISTTLADAVTQVRQHFHLDETSTDCGAESVLVSSEPLRA